jgi:hypothetical protein
MAYVDPRTDGAANFIGDPFTGSIVKVTPTLRTSYVVTRLNYPTGMTWGPDGSPVDGWRSGAGVVVALRLWADEKSSLATRRWQFSFAQRAGSAATAN